MKVHRLLILAGVYILGFWAFPLFSAESQEALPSFQGMIDDAKAPQFGLSNPDKTKNAWVKVGQSFDGWKLEEYRRDADVLVLSKNGQTRELHLSESALATPISEDAKAMMKAMNFDKFRDMMTERQKQRAMRRIRDELARQGIENPTTEQLSALEQQLDKEISSRFSSETMDQQFASMLENSFTQDEIKAQRNFWESETGQTLISEMTTMGGQGHRPPQPSETMMKFFASEEGRTIMGQQRSMTQQMMSSLQPAMKEVESVMSQAVKSMAQQNQ